MTATAATATPAPKLVQGRRPMILTAQEASEKVYATAARRNPGLTPAQLRPICRHMVRRFIEAGLFIIIPD